MSNVNEVRPQATESTIAGGAAGGATRRAPDVVRPGRTVAPTFPSPEGTAILELSTGQAARIRVLLNGLRTGKARADEVRRQIFGMLSGGQRRVLDAAWFIISVRV